MKNAEAIKEQLQALDSEFKAGDVGYGNAIKVLTLAVDLIVELAGRVEAIENKLGLSQS
jgi:hypothetical protein